MPPGTSGRGARTRPRAPSPTRSTSATAIPPIRSIPGGGAGANWQLWPAKGSPGTRQRPLQKSVPAGGPGFLVIRAFLEDIGDVRTGMWTFVPLTGPAAGVRLRKDIGRRAAPAAHGVEVRDGGQGPRSPPPACPLALHR